MTVLLGIDIGTTELTCAMFSTIGKLLAVSIQEYQLLTPQVGYVELDAEVYWEALKCGLDDLQKQYDFSKDKVALAFSAQGETMICVDEDGKPVRKAIVWMDNRAVEEAKAMEQRFGEDLYYRTTGLTNFSGSWPAAKILWIRNHEPEIFEKTSRFLLTEDYLIYKLTGRYVTEGSLISSGGYWNIVTKEYWPEMLDFLGISKNRLPAVQESGVLVGNVLPKVKKELGLTGKVVVSTGAMDQAAGAIGIGNIKEGMFSEAFGSALSICAPVDGPKFDPNRKMPLHYFAIPGMYVLNTFIPGGITLRWFRDQFCELECCLEKTGAVDAYELIDRQVERIPAGSEGLVMLPYLTGAAAPDTNAKAKGVWFGFTMKHTRAHFARAIMESLGYVVRRNIETLRGIGLEVNEIRSFGSGANSPVWNQIRADITHTRIVTMHSNQAFCLGAAILAGKSIGTFGNIDEAVFNMIGVKGFYDADQECEQVYEEGYSMFRKLFQDLGACFKEAR